MPLKSGHAVSSRPQIFPQLLHDAKLFCSCHLVDLELFKHDRSGLTESVRNSNMTVCFLWALGLGVNVIQQALRAYVRQFLGGKKLTLLVFVAPPNVMSGA